ncbi:mitochondrial import inner membrane translocase subunit TIM44-like [Notothenia coriiceps]|uniref:Mitochondrial import inner membrane translocase subunit TIM44-like n=1 Tax=Notothenia coriiceps TaxID=8208 RepID=A0A6I9Q3P0_9TELE|nr:PREDICTED: mitochondrial import inner membrane translocase subunit TIM44-like [Notothenia coriiceps]
MATPLCQCYQICVRRGLVSFPSCYLLLHNRAAVYRTHGLLTCSSQVSQSPSLQVRYMSGERGGGRGGGRKGFMGELLDNIKQELNKNKEMKDNIKKFREEAQKLEESEALKQARRKFKTIESETVKTSDVLRKKLGNISESVKEGLEEVSRTDIGKKIKDGIEEAAKSAKTSAESVSKGGEMLGKTGAFRAISQEARSSILDQL